MGTLGNIVLVGILAGIVAFRKEIAEAPLLIGQGIGGGIGAATQPIKDLFDYLAGFGCGVIRDCGSGIGGGGVLVGGAQPGQGCISRACSYALGGCPTGYHCVAVVVGTSCCPDVAPTTTTRTGDRTGTQLYIPPPTTTYVPPPGVSILCEYPTEALRLGVRCP